MVIGKYSMGIGDRFAQQGKAQLRAMQAAEAQGVTITPVWNKSHREHTIIHTDPATVRVEADRAVEALGWTGGYFVDADHIGLGNVDLFLAASDYFTLDVADCIGQPADADKVEAFVDAHEQCIGELVIPGLDTLLSISRIRAIEIASQYLRGVEEAGRIYRHIAAAKGSGNFVTEVSMDETDEPQTPEELLFILAALAAEQIPLQAIAPKFTGRFNKGVDYVGDVEQFAREFEADLAVIAFAVQAFDLSPNLKLSVHSGSDKFSIYGPMREGIRKFDAGLHLKTAGTTWLEEIIGLAAAGGDGLALAKDVYRASLDRYDELCGPYAAVIDIEPSALPSAADVDTWDSATYVSALRHDPDHPAYNRSFRQLLHVGYKVAAEMGSRYLEALSEFEEVVAQNVTENLLERHIRPLFL